MQAATPGRAERCDVARRPGDQDSSFEPDHKRDEGDERPRADEAPDHGHIMSLDDR